ncbi:MAG TPA: hypothetical protein PLP42_09355 [Acidobacteriota bacterium]|nr:hypothetical protein [Acidobacteriota bacterium]
MKSIQAAPRLSHSRKGRRYTIPTTTGYCVTRQAFSVRRFILLSFFLACAGNFLSAMTQSQPPVSLTGERIRVEAESKDGRLRERYLAFSNDTWVEVATAENGRSVGPISLIAADKTPVPASLHALSISGNILHEEFTAGEHRIIRTITLLENGPWIRVVTRLEPSSPVALHELTDRFDFSHSADWSFSPSVGGFNPDGFYKAPLILVQKGNTAFGIVPDLATLGREELARCHHALDLDVPGGPMLSVGYIPAQMVSHSVYARDAKRTWTTNGTMENAYYLLVTASAPPTQAYREAVRFHWEQFGRAEQAQAADQQVGTDPRYRSLTLWDQWRDVIWKEESPRRWLSVPLPNGSTGGGVGMKRWGPGPSVYLSSWFNTLRTSYGMALYARRTGNKDLLDLATQTVELALNAPGRDGAFKCVAVPQESVTIWAAGDGSGASTEKGFLGYDMCWTGYWLLKWHAAKLPGWERILPRCRELARFMMSHQAPDGLLPTRFSENASVQEELSRTVKAETGPVVLFLLQLYQYDPDPRLLEASRRGLAFLEKEVIPTRQWYDYETFWSCSPREAKLDERTQQWPANNLALTQTVAAYLLAYQTTGEARYLATGEALLDYLLLFQQCWTHPGLKNLTSKAMLLGGFTTQNSDAEWSDARQSQCGNILLDYYRTTGKPEYLERGVAALRAQFPVSPSENWAHEGYGAKAGVSSFHWGTGSGMAGIEIEEEYLRDAVIDATAGRGAGVNGINVTDCRLQDGQIHLQLSSPFVWKTKPVVVFHRTQPSKSYRVYVNGKEAGTWSGKELEKGIRVELP